MKNHSSKQTSEFYDDLMKGEKKFTFFPKDQRYNIDKILSKDNLIKYFDENVKQYLKDDLDILDYGCGPGTFLIKLSRLTKANLKGVDISKQFKKESKNNFKKLDVNNVAVEKELRKITFKDQQFDLILLLMLSIILMTSKKI